MSIETSIEMSAENPTSGAQRYVGSKQYENGYVHQHVSRKADFRYTTILLKKIKENDRKCTPSIFATFKMAPHYRKIENPRKSWYPEVPGAKIQKKTFVFKAKLLFFL